MKLISFQIRGRFGHFLRAEGGASAPTYPFPPRTAILGMMGAVLGLDKDQPQSLLEPAYIAITGRLPQTHWHKAKLRKSLPAAIPSTIKSTQKADKISKPEKATLIWQEWLFNPAYTVWVSMPEPYLTEIEERLSEKKWHFQPCLGLSEMMAELIYLKPGEALPLPLGSYRVNSIIPQRHSDLDMDKIFKDNLVIQSLRMPRTVTPDRIFTHADYFMERDGRPIPVTTGHGFDTGIEVLIFL